MFRVWGSREKGMPQDVIVFLSTNCPRYKVEVNSSRKAESDFVVLKKGRGSWPCPLGSVLVLSPACSALGSVSSAVKHP